MYFLRKKYQVIEPPPVAGYPAVDSSEVCRSSLVGIWSLSLLLDGPLMKVMPLALNETTSISISDPNIYAVWQDLIAIEDIDRKA